MAPDLFLGVTLLVSIATNLFLVIVLARVTHRLLSQNTELQRRDIAALGTPAAQQFVNGAMRHEREQNQLEPTPEDETLPFAR